MTQAETTSAAKPRRRYLRYSLRSLLIVVTVLAVWLGLVTERAAKQRRAVEVLRQHGARISCDPDPLAGGDPLQYFSAQLKARSEPTWWRRWLGDNQVGRVTEVSWIQQAGGNAASSNNVSPISEDDVAQLGHLTSLIKLRLNNVPLTDRAFRKLRGLTRLESLSLFGTKATDEGLSTVANFPKLKTLLIGEDLSNGADRSSAITDKGLRQIAQLPNLEQLALVGFDLTGEGFKQAQSLSKLRILELRDTAVNDAGLRWIGELKSLGMLMLDRTQVTDDGLKSLAGLSKLVDLSLRGTQVTDVGIDSLAQLPLVNCNLRETRVSESAQAQLRQLTLDNRSASRSLPAVNSTSAPTTGPANQGSP